MLNMTVDRMRFIQNKPTDSEFAKSAEAIILGEAPKISATDLANTKARLITQYQEFCNLLEAGKSIKTAFMELSTNSLAAIMLHYHFVQEGGVADVVDGVTTGRKVVEDVKAGRISTSKLLQTCLAMESKHKFDSINDIVQVPINDLIGQTITRIEECLDGVAIHCSGGSYAFVVLPRCCEKGIYRGSVGEVSDLIGGSIASMDIRKIKTGKADSKTRVRDTYTLAIETENSLAMFGMSCESDKRHNHEKMARLYKDPDMIRATGGALVGSWSESRQYNTSNILESVKQERKMLK